MLAYSDVLEASLSTALPQVFLEFSTMHLFLSSGNRNLDFDTSLDVDDDLLDDFRRCIKTGRWHHQHLQFQCHAQGLPPGQGWKGSLLNQPFMNPHLISIPRLTSLTTRRLPRSNLQLLRWEPHWPFDTEVLRLRTIDQLLAYFLQ